VSNELLSRIEALETQLSEIKKLNGIPGPRGPQGPIDVCVTQAVAHAEKVLDNRLASLFDRVELYAKRESDYGKERSESLHRELDQFRKEVRESLAQHFADEATQTRIENAVLKILVDYWVLDPDMNLLDRNQKPIQQEIPVADCGTF
jgi:hypothetical protein